MGSSPVYLRNVSRFVRCEAMVICQSRHVAGIYMSPVLSHPARVFSKHVFCHIGKLIQLDSHPNELRNQLVAMTRSHPTNEKDSQTKGVFRKSIESLRDVHSTHCVLRYKSCEQRQREALVKKTQRHSGSSKQTSLRDP